MSYLRNALFIVLSAACLLFAGWLLYDTYRGDFEYAPVPVREIEPEEVVDNVVPVIPMRLRIPKLSVDAMVEHVGLDSKGRMAVPQKFTNVSWYSPGVAPGALGNAAIAGHYDNGYGRTSVFYHLDDLTVGDSVFVADAEGRELEFIVTEIATYPFTDAPLDRIFGSSDGRNLNLITCEGVFLSEQKTYTERLVVYTTLASTVSTN